MPSGIGSGFSRCESMDAAYVWGTAESGGGSIGGGATGSYTAGTALGQEAYLRLVDSDRSLKGRPHLFTGAANSMRQILVDWARRHRSRYHFI